MSTFMYLPIFMKAASINVDVNKISYTIFLDAETALVNGPANPSEIIENLVIPDFVEYNEVQYPVTSIKEEAFCKQSTLNLKGSLTIGNNVINIGKKAFYNCQGLTGTLTIGEKVASIDDQAFTFCRGLTGSLIIPNSVTYLGYNAFGYCGFTGSLILGENVNSISGWCFAYCTGFTGSLNIPDKVTSIEEMAFGDCSGFNGSLSIGNNVTIIGDQAFENCNGFTKSLTLGNNISTIGDEAFINCSGFTGTLNIPESVTSIGRYAFRECRNFSSLTIRSQKIKLYYGAFNHNNFESITCMATAPPSCIYQAGTTVTTYVINPCKMPLYVPSKSLNAYRNAQEWRRFVNIYAIPDMATNIKLNKSSETTIVGNIFALEATITPDNALQDVKWESSDPSIATVSEDGVVKVLGNGTAFITASTTDGTDLSASCEITAWLKGDSNGDHIVNMDDIVNCVNFIAGNPVERFIFIASDINGDNDITVTDASLIAQLVVNMESSIKHMSRTTNVMGLNYKTSKD